MERNLEQDGLNTLDPMIYWRNVISGGGKLMPTVLAICDDIEEQEQLRDLAERTKANFIVETTNGLVLASLLINFISRAKDMYIGDERDKMWKRIDVLYYNGDDPLEYLPAMLSGVTVVDSVAKIENALDGLGGSLTRIDNYEKGKALLDKLLML